MQQNKMMRRVPFIIVFAFIVVLQHVVSLLVHSGQTNQCNIRTKMIRKTNLHKLNASKDASTSDSSANHSEIKSVAGLQEGMKYRTIPNTDLLVSELCLGTMTFGEQLTKNQAFEQLDMATKQYAINFIDTAESYPVPSAPSSTGQTEKIIGEWLRKNKGVSRDNIIISTKVCGFSDQMAWCRKNGEGTRVNREQVIAAVDAQLERLGTDYIDLLQIHWPDRYIPLFGSPEYIYELERKQSSPIKDQLEIMDELVKSGKIRHFGLSNETPYGATSFYQTAEFFNLPKPCAVQNCYNLLVRNDFETGMQEVCSNSNIGLLAYSPLAGGALTGKYQDAKRVSSAARMRQYVGFMHRYISPPALEAIQKYQEVADMVSLPLTQLSLAWVYSRPFVTSTLIGATSTDQLRDNILALNIPITDEVTKHINKVYRKHVDPTKGVFEVIDPNLEYIDPSKLPWGAKDEDVDPELDLIISSRLGGSK